MDHDSKKAAFAESNELNTESRKPQKFLIYSLEQAYRHMTADRSDEELNLYLATDEVLFNVWDALCLSIDQDFREEYLPFLPHTFDLLLSTEDGSDLWEYLVFIEENKFGTIKDDNLARRRATRVVETLLDYKKMIFSKKAN